MKKIFSMSGHGDPPPKQKRLPADVPPPVPPVEEELVGK